MQYASSLDSVPATAGDLGRRTALGVLVAVAAVLLTQAAVNALGVSIGSGPMSPFAAGPLVGSTVVAGIGAAVVYAGLLRVTANPGRNFVAVAAVVFVLMLVPIAVVAPSMGVTAAGQVVLAVHHLLVAVPLVAFITGVIGREGPQMLNDNR